MTTMFGAWIRRVFDTRPRAAAQETPAVMFIMHHVKLFATRWQVITTTGYDVETCPSAEEFPTLWECIAYEQEQP